MVKNVRVENNSKIWKNIHPCISPQIPRPFPAKLVFNLARPLVDSTSNVRLAKQGWPRPVCVGLSQPPVHTYAAPTISQFVRACQRRETHIVS